MYKNGIIADVSEINRLSKTQPQVFINDCEDAYTQRIDMAADTIVQNRDKYKIVLLAGPSASGKTTTSKKLKYALKQRGVRSIAISLDDFFLSRRQLPVKEDGTRDLESIQALNLPLLKECFASLVENKKTVIPKFDFIHGESIENGWELHVKENEIVIAEGIHALNPALLPSIGAEAFFKLYISVQCQYNLDGQTILDGKTTRLMRRIVRDYHYRGSMPQNTMRLWKDVVESEKKNIESYRRYSH